VFKLTRSQRSVTAIFTSRHRLTASSSPSVTLRHFASLCRFLPYPLSPNGDGCMTASCLRVSDLWSLRAGSWKLGRPPPSVLRARYGMKRCENVIHVVGCAVHTAWADLFARRLIERAGARTAPISPVEFLRDPVRQRFRALVYDLAPWNNGAVRQIAVFRQMRPEIPILFYLPPTPDAFALVPACASLTNVRLLIQERHDRGFRGLEREVAWLLSAEPSVRLLNIIETTLPFGSSIAGRLTRNTLDQLASGLRPSVTDAAQALSVSVRTLQRVMAKDGLPAPKEFLDWLTLLHVHFVAAWHGSSEAAIARRINLDANQRYRLRRRLLDRTPHDGDVHGASIELSSFRRRCGGCPRPRAATSDQLPAVTPRDSWSTPRRNGIPRYQD